jgi:hypothetical protein
MDMIKDDRRGETFPVCYQESILDQASYILKQDAIIKMARD